MRSFKRFGIGQRLMAALAVSSAFLVATAGVGQASGWGGSDNLDGTFAPSGWSFTHSGDGTGGFSNLQTHSGNRSIFLDMRGAGFSSAGKKVHLQPVGTGHVSDCAMSIWINPGPGAHAVNVEVINPQNFTYLALKTLTVSPTDPYFKAEVGWHAGPGSPADVLMRVSIAGPVGTPHASAWIDDLGYTCFF